MPSQLQENWVRQKDVLDSFARHADTGQPMPAELLNKLKDMENYGAGFAGLRQTFLGMLDMKWHTTDPAELYRPPPAIPCNLKGAVRKICA